MHYARAARQQSPRQASSTSPSKLPWKPSRPWPPPASPPASNPSVWTVCRARPRRTVQTLSGAPGLYRRVAFPACFDTGEERMSQEQEREIARLEREQHGVVSLRQLRALTLSDDALG